MDDSPRPLLNQVNVISRDFQASLAFYRTVGVEVTAGPVWPPDSAGQHAASQFPNGAMLEIDNLAMLGLYAQDAANVRGAIVGFAYPTAAAVDAAVERLTAAGHTVRQPPYDAFWGARYAVVEDPDGNAVGLMGPVDRGRGYVPPAR